jgi:NYN domain
VTKPRAFVYVDGFNLYYGSLKNTPYRWLDIGALMNRLLPSADVTKIWYFTAEPKPDPANPGVAARHREYMRALGTVPGLQVKPGFYQLKHSDRRLVFPLYQPDPKLPNRANRIVTIWKAEEKGSDVNLATALLIDAAAHRFDEAWVVSNDADLAWPVERAQAEYSLRVGVIKPERPAGYPNPPRNDSWHLKTAAAAFRKIREPQLAACQFPATLVDATGAPITKPAGW